MSTETCVLVQLRCMHKAAKIVYTYQTLPDWSQLSDNRRLS